MKKSRTSQLKRQPKVFRSLTGISVEKFDKLNKELLPIYSKSELKRLSSKKRKRNLGGGRKKELELEDQLLLTLIYYRHYVSQSFLGLIFNLHNSNVCRLIKNITPLLAQVFNVPRRRIENRLTEEEKNYNKEFSKERIKIEHVFGKMKIFQILTQRFRNPRQTHALIFKNIAGLYNLSYT